MIAAVEAYRAGLYKTAHWLPNILSGLLVGVVALPLAMAFAIASGAKPEQGIYTAIIAGFVVSFFGGTRLQIAGPTGAFIVVLAAITAKFGIEGLQLATLMGGILLILFGVLRLGKLIEFIPHTVIIGFTSGIGVIIWVSQWQDFFGLPKISGEHFHQKLWQLLHALPHLHLPTTLLALLSLVMTLFVSRLPKCQRVPGPLIALIIGTLLQSMLQIEGIATIGSVFGALPGALPSLQFPSVTWPRISELIKPALTIAMLGAIESLLSAVVADRMAGTKHNANQELIGQGLANVLTPLFGGFAATGAIARTATNVRNGATGPLSGMIHSLTLLGILLFLAPLAAHIPLATLAAILFVVAWHMSELPQFLRLLREGKKTDVLILLLTFLLTIFSDLIIAVGAGVGLSLLLKLKMKTQA
jgi:SulP family sulfate permease